MNRRLSGIVILVLRLGFGALLIAASMGKGSHPLDFQQSVDNYRVFGPWLSTWAAVFVPALEMLTGLCLVSGLWIDAAAPINAALMSAFLALVLQAFFRHLNIYCGCFSLKGEPNIDGNLLYAAGGILLCVLQIRNKKQRTVVSVRS
jgi:uncharacterized membrane protein YphA (DoxX/SURF4 family)